MFHLVLDRALLPFTQKRPAFAPLFRLPNEWNEEQFGGLPEESQS